MSIMNTNAYNLSGFLLYNVAGNDRDIGIDCWLSVVQGLLALASRLPDKGARIREQLKQLETALAAHQQQAAGQPTPQQVEKPADVVSKPKQTIGMTT